MKVGLVVLFNWGRPKFLSWAIQQYNIQKYGFEGWSHAGIITEVSNDQVLIHEAVSKGFVSSWYNKSFIEEVKKEGRLIIGSPIIKLNSVKENADNYLGRPYSWIDMIGILLTLFIKIPISLSGARGLICSEAISRILYDSSEKKINFENEFNKKYDLITPTDLFISKFIKF